MGIMDISPDQIPNERIKRTVINRKTGEIVSTTSLISSDNKLTDREKEILLLICDGYMSKEIAYKLKISLYTVNNHRKNILSKLKVDNVIEAINLARSYGIIY
jgi:DNA-binding NarL/FixJ family response regulator